jgi:hypothetical protein
VDEASKKKCVLNHDCLEDPLDQQSSSEERATTSKIQGSNDLFNTFVAAKESASRTAEAAGAVSVDEALTPQEQAYHKSRRNSRQDILGQQTRDVEKRLSTRIQAGSREAINMAREIAERVSRNVSEDTPNKLRAQLSVLGQAGLLTKSKVSRNVLVNTPNELRVSPSGIAILLRQYR